MQKEILTDRLAQTMILKKTLRSKTAMRIVKMRKAMMD